MCREKPQSHMPCRKSRWQVRSRLGAGVKLLACSLEKSPSQGQGLGQEDFQPRGPAFLSRHKGTRRQGHLSARLSRVLAGFGRQHGALAAREAGRSWETAQPGPASFLLMCCFVLPHDVVRGANWGRRRPGVQAVYSLLLQPEKRQKAIPSL